MATLLIVATAVLAPQAATVTLDTGAMRVPAVLEKLSAASGKTLKSIAALEDEVLFVSVKDRPVEEVMARIAEVCHSAWDKKPDATYLVRENATILKDRKDELAYAALEFRKSFEAGTRGEDSEWNDGNAASRIEAFRRLDPSNQGNRDRLLYSMPMGKLFRRIVGSLDFQQLLEVPMEEAVVYSTNPTRLQMPLPSGSAKAVSEFVKEHEALWSRLATAVERNNPNRLDQTISYSMGGYREAVNLPATAIVRVIRTNEDRLHFQLRVFDRDGFGIGMHQMPFTIPRKLESAATLPNIAKWGQLPVPESESGKAAVDAYLAVTGTMERAIPGADRPDLAEPLGFIVDLPMREIARGTGLDIVARLPDGVVASVLNARRGDLLMQHFVQGLFAHCRAKVEGGVLVVEPIFSEAAFAGRSRRSVLTRFFATAKGIPTLADAAEYAAKQRDYANTSFEAFCCAINGLGTNSFAPIRHVFGGRRSERTILRIFGSMTMPQRQAMVNGGIRFGDLTQPQRTAISLYFYRLIGRLARAEMQSSPVRGQTESLMESTITFPNGIPADAMLRLQASDMAALYLRKTPTRRRIVSTTDFAQSLVESTNQQRHVELAKEGLLTSPISPAFHTRLHLTLATDGATLMETSFYDNRIAGSPVASWKDLPAEHAKSIETHVASLQRRYGG